MVTDLVLKLLTFTDPSKDEFTSTCLNISTINEKIFFKMINHSLQRKYFDSSKIAFDKECAF
jgi:hypothetical protein